MSNKSLAVVYRPKTWEDVTEQESIKLILQNQIETGEVRGVYIFVGAAGTGKTTCARIFANEINKGQGVPIEMDAASHNGVDDVREIAKLAQTRAIDAEYKIFILDEVHQFSSGAWAAMLKLIEEPPAKCVFIMCTTDYWKIPKTIQSRCQRYNFQRISLDGIVNRLESILCMEHNAISEDSHEAIEYIAKQADGCMREAITLLDKCLAYSENLTMENVLDALNVADYGSFIDLTDFLLSRTYKSIIILLDEIYASGIDFKQFIKQYEQFILDVNKYLIIDDPGEAYKYINLPKTEEIEEFLKSVKEENNYNTDGVIGDYNDLLEMLIKLETSLKYSQTPKADVEAQFLLF